MGYCITIKRGVRFEAYASVYGNPNAVITLTNTETGDAFRGTCNNNGVASITIEKRGTYKITTSVTAAFEANNNDSTLNVTDNKATYILQKVVINRGTNSLAVNNAYASGKLVIYWGSASTAPTSNFTNYVLIRRDDRVPTGPSDGTTIYTGKGTSYQINTSTTVFGYLDTVTAGQTKYYGLVAMLTIGGRNYYSPIITTSGKSQTISTVTKTVTSSGSLTVPNGLRSLTYCLVGGGGGGANNAYLQFLGTSSETYYSIGGGGGEGGALVTGTITVTPGQSLTITIGAGGNGGSSQSGKIVISDYWSKKTGAAGSNGGATSITINGKTYSANGGAGAPTVDSESDTASSIDGVGGSGGSGRGNGGDGGAGFYSATTKGSYTGDQDGYSCYYNGKAKSGGGGASFDNVQYAGGGGGGAATTYKVPATGYNYYTYGTSGSGGSRGGGAGGYGGAGTAGTANTGGGGGGGGHNSSKSASCSGGKGGSGVAILKFTA